ncbi:uncharacterized protein LOC131860241 [Cryptomeria japonica]|uniref:uncharacterized protein LOC131860241 n=1 Tax=Cryptomeria japonica TaxID=3369 RepID=UPI0027D9ED84|nr:uncharacterized protein LOC131860241 [Cryptomeria japonica]
MVAKELGELGKIADDGKVDEKSEEDVNIKPVKENDEEQIDKTSTTIAKGTIRDKGKQIVVQDDLSHGLVDLSILSPLKTLKLATLAQIKASEDLLKSSSEEKEVISLATTYLEKILLDHKQILNASPSEKLKDMLNKVEFNFISLEKVTDIKVLKKFIEMRLQTYLKVIEDDKEVLKTMVKSVEDALGEGRKIFKSCLFLPKFIAEIDKQIRDFEGKLASISHSFAPHLVFLSSLEAQIIDFTNKIKGLNKEKEQWRGDDGEEGDRYGEEEKGDGGGGGDKEGGDGEEDIDITGNTESSSNGDDNNSTSGSSRNDDGDDSEMLELNDVPPTEGVRDGG